MKAARLPGRYNEASGHRSCRSVPERGRPRLRVPHALAGFAVGAALLGVVLWAAATAHAAQGPANGGGAEDGANGGGERKLAEARTAAEAGDSQRAVRLASEAVAQNPALAEAYYLRGRENFRAGHIQQSLADFDRFVQLRPRLASRQWERGITCYYAGKFEAGAKQFALYQTYHDNDVENSVWRYLCMARVEGVEKARQAILPIKNDPRIPMMEIYRMYRGELKPEEVLAAVDRGDPPRDVRQGRLFYAQLYLGLYHEVHDRPQLARRFLVAAADEHRDTRRVNRYMWDVARIHAERVRDEAQGAREKSGGAKESEELEEPGENGATSRSQGDHNAAAATGRSVPRAGTGARRGATRSLSLPGDHRRRSTAVAPGLAGAH